MRHHLTNKSDAFPPLMCWMDYVSPFIFNNSIYTTSCPERLSSDVYFEHGLNREGNELERNAPVFFIGTINIGAISEASCFNIGDNKVRGFSSQKKHNQGFGTVHGRGHRLEHLKTFLSDPDAIDMLSPQPRQKEQKKSC